MHGGAAAGAGAEVEARDARVLREYERENLTYAEPIAATPGLQWKLWTFDEENDEAGASPSSTGRTRSRCSSTTRSSPRYEVIRH